MPYITVESGTLSDKKIDRSKEVFFKALPRNGKFFVKFIMGDRLNYPPLMDNIIISGKQIKLIKDMT